MSDNGNKMPDVRAVPTNKPGLPDKKVLRVPITVSLFAVIMAIALALAGSLATYSHVSHKRATMINAGEIMARSAEVLRLRIKSLIAPAEASANHLSVWPGIEVPPDATGHPAKKFLTDLLSEHPHLSAVTIGHDDGSFYMMGTAQTRSTDRLAELSVPADTVFLEQSIFRDTKGQRLSVQSFLDRNGEVISSTQSIDPDYDPRDRPWYRPAGADGPISRTQLYQFAGTGKSGLTVSRRHENGTVGVDITLDQLDDFLSRAPQAQKGVLVLFRFDGPILASTAGTGLGELAQEALVDRVNAAPFFSAGTLEILGKPWIAHVTKAPIGTDTDEVLAMAVPVSVIAAPTNRVTRNALIASILIALASVPVIWLVAQGLSRPLVALAADADRIRRFDLNEVAPTPSIVDEIQQLQVAMGHMRTSLSVFSHYVPKALVQRLIRRNDIPELGGTRRSLTVLFMDMENFTAMSSGLAPEEVMRRMSEYFEAVTQILLAHGATIDKYIGDAVMVFWNAPDDSSDHVAAACRAALAVRDAAAQVTDQWVDDGTAPVRTRIGLHTGDAVVGNVGSSDRMNYTALGTTVNLASRLETLNRDLGTDILVSDEVVRVCEGRFSFRSIGEARIKGFSEPVEAFELVGENIPS